MTFGEKLLKLRKGSALSQEELAEKLGVSRQAISRWENEGVLPDGLNLLGISKLFGVSTDYLLNDDYQSDGDIPAVRQTRIELDGETRRKSITLLLAGLHAVILLVTYAFWARWGWTSFFWVILCAAAALADIIVFEFWLSRAPVQPDEVKKLRRWYYRAGVWFFAWYPGFWVSMQIFNLWPRPRHYLVEMAVTFGLWLAVCGAVWVLTREKNNGKDK